MKNKILNKKTIKILLFCLMVFVVISFLDNEIKNYNLRYYYGKDDGFFVRIESIIIFSVLFFGFIPDRLRALNFLIGFFYGIASVLIGYLIWFKLLNDYGLSFHIIGSLLVPFFYFFNYKIQKKGREPKG